MTTEAQAKNTARQQAAQEWMDRADEHRSEARSQAEWDRAQAECDAAAKEWNDATDEGASTRW